MRDAGWAIAPFGSMARVFPCPIPPHCKSILASPANNSPGVVSPLLTCWRCFMRAPGWYDKSWRPPCAPMISPRWSDSIRTCAPAMSWWPTGAFVPMPILPCWCRQACMPSSACIRNTSWTSPRDVPMWSRAHGARATKASRVQPGSNSSGNMTNSSTGSNLLPVRSGWTRSSLLTSPIAWRCENSNTRSREKAFVSRRLPSSPPSLMRHSIPSKP